MPDPVKKDAIDLTASDKERYEKLRKIIENILQDTDPGDTEDAKNRRKWMLWFFLYLIWWEGSRATTRQQGGGGPGRGLIQIEPATLWDLINNYIFGPTKGLIANLAKAAGVTEEEMKKALEDFRKQNAPAKKGDPPPNTWPSHDPASKIEQWLLTCDSFAIKLMRYLFKSYGSEHHFPPKDPKNLPGNPQDDGFKPEHSEGWADWWKRSFPGKTEEEKKKERDRQREEFEKRAKELDKIVAQLPPGKPTWVTAAEKVGLDAYPSNVGWVLDLNRQPVAAQTFLAHSGTNIFQEFLAADNYELLNAAHDFRKELAASMPLLPPSQRSRPGFPSSADVYTGLQSSLVQGTALAMRDRGYTLPENVLLSGVDRMIGNAPGRAEAVNGMFLSTIFAATVDSRQYLYFADAGPLVFFDTHANGAALASKDFDETDVEMVELGIEIVGLLVSILGLAVGAGAAKAASDKASKTAFRKFLTQLLKNPRLRSLLKSLLLILTGIDIAKLKGGDHEVVSTVLSRFLELIKAIWDEGMIKDLLALLGVEAAIVGSVMFILWWFGIGEILSFIMIVAGIGMLIADLVAFIAKLVDWEKRKASKPAAPASGGK